MALRMQALGRTRNRPFSFKLLRRASRMNRTFPPHMRVLVLSLATAIIGGCRCSPATPSPVTLRVKNNTRDPIYVDDTRERLGLEVRREVGGQLFGFDEQPCACNTCLQVCDTSCRCPDAGTPFIRRIGPGESAERTWSGVVQVSGLRSCGRGTEPCLDAENAPLDEPFTLRLCYTHQLVGVDPDSADGGRVPGDFPAIGVSCIDKRFAPADGVAEVGPQRGADCTTTADCKGQDELCFGGACTAGCPGNDFPVLGSNWALSVARPDDRGFFATSTDGGVTNLTGTGTVTSAVYNGTTLTLRLSRPGPVGEALTAALFVTFPRDNAAPIPVGGQVRVALVEKLSQANQNNRALVLRDAASGKLLFAADVAQGGRILSDLDLSPLSLSFGEVPVGCRTDACGRQLFFTSRFAVGADAVTLEPGKAASLNTTQGIYRFVNVSNGAWTDTLCALSDIRPWTLWLER